MALSKELISYPLISERPSLVSSASHFKKKTQATQFSIKPFDRRPMKSKSSIVAAISEDLVRTLRLTTTTGDRQSEEEKAAVKFKVRAVVTVRNKNKEDFKETLVKQLDAFGDKIGRNIVLELISTELDPKTNLPKKSNAAVLKDWSKKSKTTAERVHYTAEFTVDAAFGSPGAITVTNKH